MKKTTLIITLLLAMQCLYGQSIQRSVIGSAGKVSAAGNIILSATVGETAVKKLSAANYGISQGFQQGIRRTDSTMLYVLAYLQGFYGGGYTMRPALFNQGVSTNQSIADTITIELRPASNPSVVAAHAKMILYTNANASSMMHVNNGNYYVVLKHRNHVETWSAAPVAFTGTFAYHDFTWAASQAYGNNMKEIEPGYYAIYSGDINKDENVDLLDASLVETDINNFNFGYYSTDINGDGNVDLLDSPIVEANTNAFIYAVHP